MESMFSYCYNFTGKGLENWEVDNIRDIPNMFKKCYKFKGKGLENWNVSKVKNMSYMFDGCRIFNADLSFWGDKLGLVRSMEQMFADCVRFEGRGLENLDVSKVKYMEDMLFNCNITDIDFSSWIIPNDTYIGLDYNYDDNLRPIIRSN